MVRYGMVCMERKMEIIKQSITARSRKLKASWTLESMKDLMIAHYGGLHWFFDNDIIWHEILPDNTIED